MSDFSGKRFFFRHFPISQLSYVAKIGPANKFRAEADDYGFLEEIGRGIRKNYASNLEMTENAIFPSFYVTSL